MVESGLGKVLSKKLWRNLVKCLIRHDVIVNLTAAHTSPKTAPLD